MDRNFLFLNFDGLDDTQVKHLNGLLHPSNLNPAIKFPWENATEEENNLKGSSSLNVHAPAFEAQASKLTNHTLVSDSYCSPAYNSERNDAIHNSMPIVNYSHDYSALNSRILNVPQNYSNGSINQHTYNTYNQTVIYNEPTKTINDDIQPPAQTTLVYTPTNTFKFNPTVSCFVPSNFHNQILTSTTIQVSSVEQRTNISKTPDSQELVESKEEATVIKIEDSVQVKQNGIEEKKEVDSRNSEKKLTTLSIEKKVEQPSAPSAPPSWADIVSKRPVAGGKTNLAANKPLAITNGNKSINIAAKDQDVDNLSIEEDKCALILGKHLYQYDPRFDPVYLQPRGLINRRNWCYVNAPIQALLACPPFYSLLRSLPHLEELERGKSATPIIDCMVKVALEITAFESAREELQPGSPFQPDIIYDMLKDLKSVCLKGQQEDAEEFLSFILNGMHEEMVKVIKYYERKNDINMISERKQNGDDASESEEDWTVIGSKHRGMVTRKVAEHKTPISDLFGGQIKSFLTTSGSKTSASIQPFFTLQLDIQSDKVTSVLEALKEMTVKEPIQGYTCAKTKQEVEAYSHVALQKLPPILILHLKRFVYNKNGGCKKVMKKTDYPVELELSKDLFSSDVKKNHRLRVYRLFAVMYHDGEEAVKGHYISDVYNYGSQTWIRCDDRTITAVSEAQVLSHSPPRVPYLLFYQES